MYPPSKTNSASSSNIITMAISSTYHTPGSNVAKTLCYIVGIACLFGFFLDIAILSLPFDPLELAWRINVLQQAGDRSIVLLFGAALTLYGSLGNQRQLRLLAIACLVFGISFHLSCILVIRDTLILHQEAIRNINTEMTELQTQIQEIQSNPTSAEEVTPEELQEMSQSLSQEATSLKQIATTDATKSGLASVSNLVIVGFALIGTGRYGLQLSRH